MSITACFIAGRIVQVRQPEGGYIPPKTLEVVSLGGGADALNPEENVDPYLVNSAVGYMTRFMMGRMPAKFMFGQSISMARRIGGDSLSFKAYDLAKAIKGSDDESIINAVKLCEFDACIFAGPESYQPIEEINPDEATVQNVKTMVERSFHARDTCTSKWPMPGTLWDFQASKSRPTEAQTLQLLIDWFENPWFWDYGYLAICNPRLNEVYRISVDDIPKDVMFEVDQDVLGYPE